TAPSARRGTRTEKPEPPTLKRPRNRSSANPSGRRYLSQDFETQSPPPLRCSLKVPTQQGLPLSGMTPNDRVASAVPHPPRHSRPLPAHFNPCSRLSKATYRLWPTSPPAARRGRSDCH